MASPQDALIARMRRARRITVELNPDAGDGKRVHLLRPPEEQALQIVRAARVSSEDVLAAACGWDGITEADLLGPDLGAGDQVVEFAPEIFAEYVRDRAELLGRLMQALAEAINAHFERRAETAKN